MTNLLKFIKIFIFSFLFIPYFATLFDYLYMYLFQDLLYPNWLSNRKFSEIMYLLFMDSTYLLFVQSIYRGIIIVIAMLLGELLFQGISNRLNRANFYSVFGVIISFVLFLNGVVLGHSHSYWEAEVFIFYPILGFAYGKFSEHYLQKDSY